jgi:hypothetical protein
LRRRFGASSRIEFRGVVKGNTEEDSSALRTLVLVWLGWASLTLAFQAFVQARFDLVRPDNALEWSAQDTADASHKDRPYLADPTLKGHAAWDSEYYVSIALAGYDDPAMRAVGPASTPDAPQVAAKRDRPGWVSLDHAFFPGYPAAMRFLAWPLQQSGVRPVAAAVVAGVVVSLLGALAAMLAIADLAEGRAFGAEGRRAGFYLLVWPGSIFLAQVYSEGLFLGLSFGALALMRRGRWPLAAALGAAAVWTRATGALLLIPFVWTFVASGDAARLVRAPSTQLALRAALALSPAIAYGAWRALLGGDFQFVEQHYFGRGLLDIPDSLESWGDAWDALTSGALESQAYYLIEVAALAAALAASALLWRRDKALTLYGLAVLGVALTSGAELGLQRYVLSLPALFLAPARLGAGEPFDRLWTFSNILGFAALATAFSFGFWAG